MASNTREDLQQDDSVETGNAGQLQQEELSQATDKSCPICLDAICYAARMPACFHFFCFSCIWQWAAINAVCPICRQPFEYILCAMQGDCDYQQYRPEAIREGEGADQNPAEVLQHAPASRP